MNFSPVSRTGIFLGIVSAVTYGMNPLFALPLFADGFSPDAVLFLRYAAAVLMLGGWMRLRHSSFRVTRGELIRLIPAGVVFASNSLFLFLSYQEMDAGIASTLLFVYPLMVALLMRFFFHERISLQAWGAMLLALAGIALLYRKSDGSVLSTAGVVLVMLSSLGYAAYLVAVNRTILEKIPGIKLTFYTLLFGMPLFAVRLLNGAPHWGVFHLSAFGNLLGLALVTTVISVVCTTLAIQRVGATVTAILGALEPVTAVFFGVLMFHEDFSIRIAGGIVLILIAVSRIAWLRRAG